MGEKNTKNKSSSTSTQGSPIEIELIEIALFTSAISILSGYIFLKASSKALNTEYSRLSGIEPPIIPPTVAQIVVIGAIISLINNLILTFLAFTRLKQRENSIREGTTTLSLVPNINISIGSLLGLIGSVFLTTGAIQNERQSRITII